MRNNLHTTFFVVAQILALVGCAALAFTYRCADKSPSDQLVELSYCTRLSGCTLSSYFDSFDPRSLAEHTQWLKAAKHNLEKLRAEPALTATRASLLRQQAELLHEDENILREFQPELPSYQRIQGWREIRRHCAETFDKSFADYQSISSTNQDNSQVNWLLLFVGACLSVSGMSAIIFQKQMEKCFQDALNKCNLALAENGIMVPDNSNVSLYQRLQTAIKTLNDTVWSLNNHERAMVDNAVDMVCRIDVSGRFQTASPSCLKLVGYREEELIGTRLIDYVQGEDSTIVTDTLHGASQSADLRIFENWFKTKCGKLICLRWSAHWSVSENLLFCIAHDITDSKAAAKLLEEKAEEMRLLFESLPAGVIVLDEKLKVDITNSTIKFILDYTDDLNTLSGKSFKFIFPELDLEALLAKLNESGETLMLEENACTRSGELVPVQLSCSRLLTQKKWLLVVSDMRSKVAIESMKREFIAMVGHDLRTPLSSIRTFFEVLQLIQIPALSAGQVVRMTGEVDRLIRLINDLLDMEKMRSGKFEIHTATVRISEIVDASINAIGPIAAARKISIQQEFSDSLCIADGARTIQILVNLLSNALKFSPKHSRIVIGIRESNDTHLVVYVEDQGRGVPEEQRRNIFEKFTQVCSTDATEKGGSGLGLHICKTLVTAQGGEIWMEPKSEEGSIFCFSLLRATVSLLPPEIELPISADRA